MPAIKFVAIVNNTQKLNFHETKNVENPGVAICRSDG